MKILVLNCGSSSLKYRLFDSAGTLPQVVAKGSIDRIGISGSDVRNHEQAIEAAFQQLLHDHVLESQEEIRTVGHRVVHGGERFQESVLLTEEIVHALEQLSELAPLHNPANLEGYYAARKHLPDARHVAVFDTAFHSQLPEHAFLFGLPYRFYQEQKIRRYGFHGTSHRYISQRYAEIVGSTTDKIISCHLGNGCSVAAIDSGISIDTSMGFTPLDGLLMGTRAGEIDAGAVLHLMRTNSLNPDQVESILNHESGLLGVSGISSDMREVLRSASSGNRRAQSAIDLFCYRVRKYIGAYAAALDGPDGIVFEGGIGENASEIRSMICQGLSFMGIELNEKANSEIVNGNEGKISSERSSVDVWTIPTNEELVIAQDAVRLNN